MTLLKVISFILCLFAIFIAYHFTSNAPVTTDEILRPDEQAQTKRSVDDFINVIEENKTSYVARGAHSKGHACVKAYFNINKHIPPNLQQGIYSIPGKTYKSWIRFSNGRSSMKGNHDADKDAHGMAIKLIDIESNTAQVQDFLMHDSPVFFTANIQDYNNFVESDNKILYFVSDMNPFDWHLRELLHGLNTLKSPPFSPLRTQYFSNTAYKLGPHNIKFSAKSCTTIPEDIVQDRTDADFLRKTMAEELKKEGACFDFMVQLQDPEKYMPIEDPSIQWMESDSPFVPIARITIPKQIFDSEKQQTFCENLSFSPWNALEEHRPIGQLNRIRKEVYQASSKYRHEKNNAEIPTNLDW